VSEPDGATPGPKAPDGPEPPREPRASRTQLVVGLVLLGLLAVTVWAVKGGPAPAPISPSSPSHESPTPPEPTTVPSTTTAPTPTTAPRPARTPNQTRAGVATGYVALTESDADLARDLDAVAGTGAQWVRFDFDWSYIQRGGPSSFDWSATDRVVEAVHARNMSVVALPTYTPGWARPRGTSDKRPPTNPQDYADFVAAAARRYAPLGVDVWEIWNEPNVAQFWQHPDPVAYTRLLQAAATALRAAEPRPTILTGGVAPASDSRSSVSPTRFVQGIYDAGGRDSFDAVAVHPYTFPDDPTTRVSSNAFLQTRDVHAIMAAHGDGAKLVWATEVGAPTRGAASVGEETQARWLQEYFTIWNSWPWTGPMLWYSIRDVSAASEQQDAFGLLRASGTAKPGYTVFGRIMATP
jgi:hypothetical protein